MAFVGQAAPNFTLEAVVGDNSFKEISLSDFKGKYVLLLFYPLDFTFVCPSELLAFNTKYDEFRSKGVEVLACSVDSKFSHQAWKQLPINKGGIAGTKFSLLADVKKEVAKAYGVLHPDGVALRGLFLIDKEGVLQHALINNLPLGRSVDEALRMVDALQFTEEHGEVCPANWKKGSKGMKPTAEGVAEYLSSNTP